MVLRFLLRRARARRGAIMIVSLIIMIVLLILAVGILKLTGSGVEGSVRSTNVNQSQQAATVAVQQAVAWLEDADLTTQSLESVLASRDDSTPAGPRSSTLGRSCYTWSFGAYDADKGTIAIHGRGVSPGTLDLDGACQAPADHTGEDYEVTATAKVAPAALGYAIAGNDIDLGGD